MKHILAAILAISAFAANATSFPHSQWEANQLQLSPEWNTLSEGYKLDVLGAYSAVDRSTHLDAASHSNPTPHLDAPVIDRSNHLDSAAHQEPVTPHLDAPVIDRSSHLDGQHNQVVYVPHNNPEGIPVVQNVQPSQPSVVDKRGASARPDIRVVVREVTHNTETKTVVKSEQRLVLQPVNVETRYDDSGVRSSIQTNSKRLSAVNSRVDSVDRELSKQSSDIKSNSRNIKRVGANAAAASNLHFNRSESGFALSLGQYRDESAIAGGLQFNVGESSAVTVQVSVDSIGTSESVGYHQSW